MQPSNASLSTDLPVRTHRSPSENEQLLRALLDGPVAVAVMRMRDQCWCRVNDAFLLLTGYDPREVLGSEATRLWADTRTTKTVLRQLKRGTQVQGRELAFVCKDGSMRFALVTADPVQLGGEECVVFVLVDITGRRNAEALQRQTEAELHRKSCLLAALNRAQSAYLDEGVAGPPLERLLAELVSLTASDFGVIYEVTRNQYGVWLNACAMTDLAKTEHERAIMEQHRRGGNSTSDLSTLAGRVIYGQVVRVPGTPRPHDLGGLPPGHPEVESFLGLPLKGRSDEVVGVLTLANRVGGYDRELEAWLEPALGVCGSIVHAQRSLRAQQQAEAALRESEDRFRLLIEGVRDYALIMLDPYGRVSSWNEGATHITGFRAVECVGLHTSCFYAEAANAAGEAELHLAIAEREGRCEVEGVRVRKDGTDYWASVTLTPLRDEAGRLRGFAQLTRDITQKKQLARLKDEFVSVVSHELRTPLTAIRGALGLLAGGVLGEIPPLGGEVVNLARANCERLVRLVSDILDIEKFEAGRMELKLGRVDPEELVSRTLAGLRSWAGEAGVSLRHELSSAAHWRADEDRIIQVLTNLVSNAIKFSPEGGEVLVRVRAGSAGQSRVEVVDHGPGIPTDQVHLLFGKFQQLDSSDRRKKGGTGLGLAISKAIVELHGGVIGVVSEPGRETTFSFEVPCSENA